MHQRVRRSVPHSAFVIPRARRFLPSPSICHSLCCLPIASLRRKFERGVAHELRPGQLTSIHVPANYHFCTHPYLLAVSRSLLPEIIRIECYPTTFRDFRPHLQHIPEVISLLAPSLPRRVRMTSKILREQRKARESVSLYGVLAVAAPHLPAWLEPSGCHWVDSITAVPVADVTARSIGPIEVRVLRFHEAAANPKCYSFFFLFFGGEDIDEAVTLDS